MVLVIVCGVVGYSRETRYLRGIHPFLPFLGSDTNVIPGCGSQWKALLRSSFKIESSVSSVLICRTAASETLGSMATFTPRVCFSRAAPSQWPSMGRGTRGGIPAQWRNFSSRGCCFEAPHQPSQVFPRAALQSEALHTQFFFLPALPSQMSDLHYDLRLSSPSPAPFSFSYLPIMSCISNSFLVSTSCRT